MATRMEPSRVKYNFVEEVERLDYYVPGGYHPVAIGDELCTGRYVITHKLGFGRSATTWLAEDRKQGRLVALKLSTAEAAGRTHEIQILSQLDRAKSGLPGKAIVQNLLNSFKFSGPNGTHQCLVTDAARISIHEAKDAAYHRLLHLPAARAIASLLILGLQFIHSQGIVHGESRFAESLVEPLSFPGDIWTLACTIWDVFGSGPPFEAFPVTLNEVTIEHVEMLAIFHTFVKDSVPVLLHCFALAAVITIKIIMSPLLRTSRQDIARVCLFSINRLAAIRNATQGF
ncbi:predicted protein [Histoplasma mississippiense (nom. inval.)]|uniref:predicted protein n=1 Tax=Ajellomyces capsulatus (strain NAm1 / WU24) TaxID=2059318 RepID=UPI000157B5C1|nr:predicted protein [Histoplasma mississippiense (nom. inval.)]EDN02628.1 predicted protein [Histoplasma mississippiense (nom. inval.)]